MFGAHPGIRQQLLTCGRQNVAEGDDITGTCHASGLLKGRFRLALLRLRCYRISCTAAASNCEVEYTVSNTGLFVDHSMSRCQILQLESP